jgi:MFS family permease
MTRRLVRETFAGLPRQFWYLWAGTLINRAASFVVIFMAFYLTEARGFGESFTGLVIGLQGGGGAVGVLIGGVLADRWGRRPTLLLGHFGAAVALIALGLSTSALAIVITATVVGVLSNLARPAFGAMMIDIVSERDRVRAFSLTYLAINLGFSIAALLAGLVAEVDYLLLFLLDAATSLITAVIVIVKIVESRPEHPVRSSTVHAGSLFTVLRDRIFLVFAALNLVVMIVFMQHITALPLAMQHDGLAPAAFGLAISLNGILIVAGQLLVPRVIGNRAPAMVLAVSTVVTGVGFGLTAFAADTWLYAVSVLVWTVGEMAMAPTSAAVLADLSPTHLRGRYQSVFSLSFSLAALLAPIIGGWAIQRYGDPPLWLGCFVLAVIAAAGHLAASPARRRRIARLQTAQPAVTREEVPTV